MSLTMKSSNRLIYLTYRSVLVFLLLVASWGRSKLGLVLLPDGFDLAEGSVLHQLFQLIEVDGLSLMCLLIWATQGSLLVWLGQLWLHLSLLLWRNKYWRAIAFKPWSLLWAISSIELLLVGLLSLIEANLWLNLTRVCLRILLVLLLLLTWFVWRYLLILVE